jgi:hypothetical protein
VDEGELKKTLENSLCFGLYVLPESSSAIAGASWLPGPRSWSGVEKILMVKVDNRQKQSKADWTGKVDYGLCYCCVYD